MLYDLWLNLVRERRNELALRDAGSGRRWTFGELLAASERCSCEGEVAFPQGHAPEFVFTVLAAWRLGKLACPLEASQSPPAVSAVKELKTRGCAHLKTTSATTGPARLIAFTASQLAADARNIVETMGLKPDWPNLAVVSMSHSYGFSNLVLPLLLHGIPLVIVPAPLPEAVRLAAENEAGVTIAGAPALWRAWHQAGAISTRTRLGISAGAPLSVKLEQEIYQKTGLKVHNFYGSSECGGIAYDHSPTPRADDRCVGGLMKNVQVSLAADGCLVVQSAAAGETYWPEESASLGNGIFKTNDLAELRNGLIFLQGRLSDQINVAGRKVSPETVERALRAHPQVFDCLVFGAPGADPERGDAIVAIVVAEASETDLKQFLLRSLPAWQTPKEWQFAPSLPANARGKMSRAQWRQEWISRKVSPAK